MKGTGLMTRGVQVKKAPPIEDLLKQAVTEEGWSVEMSGTEYMVICSPWGYVTISIVEGKRGYRWGMSTIGKLNSTKTYKGRGWLAQLSHDAVAWLKSVEPKGRKD